MRWGLTHEQRKAREKERVSVESKGVRCFALLPIQMSDGSTVWLDHYYRYAVCGTNEDGTLYQYMIGGWEDAELYYKRYPDKSDSHIEISEYKGK